MPPAPDIFATSRRSSGPPVAADRAGPQGWRSRGSLGFATVELAAEGLALPENRPALTPRVDDKSPYSCCPRPPRTRTTGVPALPGRHETGEVMVALGAQEIAFLVVEDDMAVAKSFARLLSRWGEVTVAHSVREALAALETMHAWTAIFLDWQLGDGTGSDVLGPLRKAHPHVPILVVTATDITPIANIILDHHAAVMAKNAQDNPKLIEDFVARAVARQTLRAEGFEKLVQTWRERYGLTRAEGRVLGARFAGATRERLAVRLGIEEATLSTHINNLLKKTRDSSLDAALVRAVREYLPMATKSPP